MNEIITQRHSNYGYTVTDTQMDTVHINVEYIAKCMLPKSQTVIFTFFYVQCNI